LIAVAIGLGALVFVLVALLMPATPSGQGADLQVLAIACGALFVSCIGGSMVCFMLYRKARGSAPLPRQRSLAVIALATAEGPVFLGAAIVLIGRQSGSIAAAP
jgi:hypothetical protein